MSVPPDQVREFVRACAREDAERYFESLLASPTATGLQAEKTPPRRSQSHSNVGGAFYTRDEVRAP